MNHLTAEFAALTEQMLQQGRGLRFLARGRSMYPFIREGDAITVEPIEGGQLRLGDVIFYKSNEGRIVIHRVIKRVFHSDSLMAVTKGDANLALDRSVPLTQVLGRVKLIERGTHTIVLDARWARYRGMLYVICFLCGARFKAIARKLLPFLSRG